MSVNKGNQSSPDPATQPSPTPWWVYLVRAENGALYCGISNNPQRRLQQHKAGKGARFFHTSPAVALVYQEPCINKHIALKRELAIKKLAKHEKEKLVIAGFSTTPASGAPDYA